MLTKDYINSINDYNSNLDSEHYYDSVYNLFELWLKKNDKLSLENKFIQSLHYFYEYRFDLCKTHLAFLYGYSEEIGIDVFNSRKFSIEFLLFYNYLISVDSFDFWIISRLLTLVGDYFIGRILLKNILVFRENNGEEYFTDNTSIEYFNMYLTEVGG